MQPRTLVTSSPATLYASPIARSLPATDAMHRATSSMWIRCTNGKPSARHEDRASLPQALEEDRLAGGERRARADRVRDAHRRRREALVLEEAPQVVLTLHLADAVRLARVVVRRVVSPRLLAHGMHEAAPVHRHRAGEHEVLDAAPEQLDQRLEVAGPVRRVVEHDVEVVPMVGEHVRQHAGLLTVAVQAARAVRHLGQVAVEDGDLVTARRQLEQQPHPDVPVAAQNENAFAHPHRFSGDGADRGRAAGAGRARGAVSGAGLRRRPRAALG